MTVVFEPDLKNDGSMSRKQWPGGTTNHRLRSERFPGRAFLIYEEKPKILQFFPLKACGRFGCVMPISLQGTELYSSDYYTKLSSQPRWSLNSLTRKKEMIILDPRKKIFFEDRGGLNLRRASDIGPMRSIIKSKIVFVSQKPFEVCWSFETRLLLRLNAPAPPDGLIGVARALPSQMVSCHWLLKFLINHLGPPGTFKNHQRRR